MMLKHVVAALVMSSALLAASVASADDTKPTPEGKVYVLKPIKIVGTRQLPSVVIEIARLSAAHEAGVAHEGLRKALLEASVPATLKAQ